MTAIWRNTEFRALDEAPQRAYLMLVTQPEITAAGVLALRLRRWADMAADTSVDSLVHCLKVLESGRFIVVDWDAEELLIRSFIRWDGGFNNPKRRPVIVRDASEVVSPTILGHLRTEFARCGISTDPDGPPDKPSGRTRRRAPDSLSTSRTEINKVDPGPDPFPQVDSLTDTVSTNRGVVVTLSTPRAATHNPKNTKPTVSREDHEPEPGDDQPTAQTLVGEWLDLCRKRPPNPVIGQTSKIIKRMLEDGIDPDDIRGGIEPWSAKGLHPSALPAVVNEYMNSRPSAIAPPNRIATTDQRFAAIQALKRPSESDHPTLRGITSDAS
jgi:hypothetical protein